MNIENMKECILDNAYILICEKWGYGSLDLSYELFRYYIKNALFIKYGNLYEDCLGKNFNELADKTGLNFIMNRGLKNLMLMYSNIQINSNQRILKN
ncbi:hypothetical protein HANVADRAFT_51618 [Hanseniaspora valbyensis NRRL Y-1626]|uniref:Uncharacterized protein n=1 Tax=Hanseniaspora valbyensis NRRL Y-1626 TaxID=766949 RepID=A0A1B7THS7_9ASCO|nr:hypothetical protein HANVADRAFT_51618 [Hanseniaspora valbyensis NRRL Y-1626]